MNRLPVPAFVSTVAYVRGLRIGSLALSCEGKRAGGYRCDHSGTLDLAPFADALPLTAIERRLVCTACGAIGAVDARPNWNETAGRSLFGRHRIG